MGYAYHLKAADGAKLWMRVQREKNTGIPGMGLPVFEC
jgi:hypothetical protein